MESLAIAFSCAWIGVALYVGWLGRQQRRLATRLEELARREQGTLKECPRGLRVA
jgi:CcmD family protein